MSQLNIGEPQNDRELMLMIGGEVKRLSEAIDRFADKLENFEENKLVMIDDRIKTLEKWHNQWDGVWKFVTILAVLLSIVGIIMRLK